MSAAGINSLSSAPTEADLRSEIERLAKRNADLERSNIELERFVFVASHDLQEPLRVVTTYAQLLARKYSSSLDGEAAVLVDNIVHGAARMRNLVSDLLAYGILRTRPQEEAALVDVNQVLDNAIQNLKMSIDECAAEVSSDPLPVVRARSQDLLPLFQNMLANAIKYRSERPPRVHVSARREQGQLVFSVSDNGIGIEPEYHRRIFEPMRRLHGKDIPGTGMGLAICTRLIERYGGRIWVESRAGDGATFRFTLPQCEVQPEAEG
jgi:light-regulated signal transduction histidine kinase (bacteriophytochrome)